MANVIGVLAIIALVGLVYWPGLHGGFVFDDYANIVDNPGFQSSFAHWRDWMAVALSSPASSLQRPLSMLTFIANVRFAGLDPVAMKLTNIAIHALNVVLVFLLARTLLDSAPPSHGRDTGTERRTWAPLFVAAAWALHPINLMAVLYVVQRMESLCHTFVFLGLWLYLLGRRGQLAGERGWLRIGAGLIGCTTLGLLCKESAVLLPLYALGIELCVFRFRDNTARVDRRIAGLYLLVLVIPALAAVALLLPQALRPEAYAARDFTLAERLLTEPRVVLGYLRWIVAPDLRTLGLYHDDIVVSRGLLDPPATLAAMVALLLLAAGAWRWRKRHPLVALGVFWFLAAQVLTATFIPLELVFEHRNYFASLGICLALADLFLFVPPPAWRRIGALLACCFVLYCAGITWLRAREWSDPLRFAATEAAKHPLSPRATYEYARALIIVSNYDRRSPAFDLVPAAIAHAQRAPGSGPLADQAALMFAARTDTLPPPGTWDGLQRKLRQQHGSPEAQLSLMALVDCTVAGHCNLPREDMLGAFGAALEGDSNPAILDIYAKYALRVLDDSALASRAWRQAVVEAPGVARYRVNLAALLIDLGRFDEARAQVEALRSLGRMHQYDGLADQLQLRLLQREGRAIDGGVVRPAEQRTH
jgi:hypothetical protein